MIHPGLVSITFRQLTPAQIVDLVAQAALAGVEWGGDIHVPHGDVARAREVRRLTENAGLTTAAYGSYYRLGENAEPFGPILDCAVALGAPTIRVWAGQRGSAEADAAYRRTVAQNARAIAEESAAAGISVSLEFHGHSLTDTGESAAQLLQAVDHNNLKCYWQPPVACTIEQCLDSLECIFTHLGNVHVFSWGPDREKFPLADGQTAWAQYLAKIANAPGDRWAMIEFVKDEQPAQFRADAATLKTWLARINQS